MAETTRVNQVRAKFRVQSISKGSGGTEVILAPQYDERIPEDQRFAKATPSGELRMMITNPPAEAFFEPGATFYLDFTRAPEAAAHSG